MATKALLTSEELERIQAATGKNYELVRGELYEVMPPNFRHGQIAGEIHALIRDWSRRTQAGSVTVESGFTLERRPDTVRGPDVSFVAKGRLSRDQARKGFPDLAPDFVAEVRSPDDGWAELRAKAQEYLRAGSRMVVLVEPDEFIEVWRPGEEPLRLGLEDELDGGDVLPGFSCGVTDLFPPEI